MATPTYTPLATVTADGSTDSYDFTSIPSTYRDLILVFSGGVTTGIDDLMLRLNNDSTSSIYSYVVMEGNGSSASSFTDTRNNLTLTAGTNIGTGQSTIIVQIMDYSASDKHTTVLSRHNNTSAEVNAFAGRWANTAVVNQVNVFAPAYDFSSGTTISLYGVKA